MSENEFELDGVEYVSVEDVDNNGCDSCAFLKPNSGCAHAPGCCSQDRIDGRDVIFMEKRP